MSILKALPDDLVEIVYLVRVCDLELSLKGCIHLKLIIPKLQNYIDKGNVYIYKKNEVTLGMIVFQTDQSPEHANINWKFNEKQVLNVENVIIHHFWQKKGIEEELLEFAEKHAQENNFKAIRLDAYAIDEYIVDLFKKKNYEKAGEIFYPFQKTPFICFEKKL